MLAQLENRFDGGSITSDAFQRAASAIANYEIAGANIDIFEDAQAALGGDSGALQQFLRPNAASDRGGGNPRGGGSNTSAAELREANQLAEQIDRTIEQTNDRFSAQPTLIESARAASGELDAIIADLSARQPPDFAETISSAQAAQAVIAQSLTRPFEEMEEAHWRQIDVQELILAGREDEAEALQRIEYLVDRVGFATEEQREAILANVEAERQLNDQLEERQELIGAYQDAIGSARGDLEALLSGNGEDFLANFQQTFQQLRGRVLTEQLFGPALRELDDYVRENTGIATSVDIMRAGTEEAGDAATDFATTLAGADARVAGLFTRTNAPASAGGESSFEASFAEFFAAPGATETTAAEATKENTDEIRVIGRRVDRSALALSPEQFFSRMSADVAGPILEGLNDTFGVEFFTQFEATFAGALSGYARAGTVGGVLGGLQGLNADFGADIFGKGTAGFLDGILGKALGGAQSGQLVNSLAGAIGLDLNQTGSTLGGAVGSFLPIPGGEIIGSIAGGLFGKLFESKPFGTASLTGATGSFNSAGKQSDIASGLGGSVQQGLQSIAESLGAELGAFRVSIGTYNDSFRVSTTGQTGKLSGNSSSEARNESQQGLYRFTDEAAAVSFALSDAIKDGALIGLSAAQQLAIRSTTDIDKAVSEALKVGTLEQLIAGLSDDYSQALRDFEDETEERLRIARAYGLDIVEVERINAEERADIVEAILADRVGSLRDLLEDLAFGDLAEGTLAERRQRLLTEIAQAETDAAAGEDGAADRLASLNRSLIDLSRDVYGTAGDEFGADRDQAIASAERIIALEEARLADQTDAVTSRIDESNRLLEEQNAMLARQIAATIALGIAPGGSYPAGGGRPIETTREII